MSKIRAKLVISHQPCNPSSIPFKSQPRSSVSSQECRSSAIDGKLTIMMTELHKVFTSLQQQLKDNYQQQLIQIRDQHIQVQGPKIDPNLQTKQLQKWLTKVCNQTFSIAFQQYKQGTMTFAQSKIFCSQNILRNIALICQQNQLRPESFQLLDRHIRDGVLKYMAAKYPLTQSTNINKKLNNMVKEIDNYYRSQYDFFHDSNIVFELRQSGNYNDLIMKVINAKIRETEDIEINQEVGFEYEELSNYQKFQNYFNTLFQKVQDAQWMAKRDAEISPFLTHRASGDVRKKGSGTLTEVFGGLAEHFTDEAEKKKLTKQEKADLEEKTRQKNAHLQKYKQKVKSYTHFLIGRKLSESILPYSQKQIDSLHLVIRHSSVLRILTKWCEQLWSKFENKDYYLNNNVEGLKSQRGSNVNTISLQLKQALSKLMGQQRIKIDSFMKDIAKNNYEMQHSLMQKQLKQSDSCTYIEPIEKACGVFSAKVVNNLHNYIITYLNRLIHGLLKVAKKWHSNNRNLLKAELWPGPPNLLTLKIGDLMRCKCVSHEHEIITLYKHILKTSREQPDELKIIRVKNRLKKSTNDILINVRMFGKYVCEIQLAIQGGRQSTFGQYSNQFGHYLYELGRSVFGPITQICSIWSTLDPRTAIYEQFVHESYNQNCEGHLCESTNKATLLPFERPFICSECKVAFSHNYYITKHVKCENCNYWRCAKCQLERFDERQILESMVVDEEVLEGCKKIQKDKMGVNSLPQYGLAVYKCSKVPKVEYFKKIFLKNKFYLFGLKQERVYQVAEVYPSAKMQNFLKNYLIFELSPEIGQKYVKIDKEKANYEFLLLRYLNEVFQKERESLCLQEEGLTDSICEQLFGEDSHDKDNIRHLDLQENRLTSIKCVCMEFPNLQYLQLSSNQIQDYSGLQFLKQLQQLYLSHHPLPQGVFPTQICKLSKLQVLHMTQVDLAAIPSNIDQLSNLKKLQLGNNNLVQLPQQIQTLEQLQYLGLYTNRLTKLTKEIGHLTNLNTLILSDNKLTDLPSTISQLVNLVYLDIQSNQLTSITFNFSNLKKLKELDISNNSIETVSQDMGYLPALQTFNASFNKLTVLPQYLRWKNLTHINLNHNLIAILPYSFYSSSKLQKIQLSNNKLTIIDDKIANFKHLTSLNLANNQLMKCPSVDQLQDLVFLSIASNKIDKLIPNIGKLTKLEYLYASANKIQLIPFSIKTCLSLKQLYLAQNNIRVIPDSIGRLRSLEENHLDFSQNPIQIVQCADFVLSKGDYMTKRLIRDKIGIGTNQNQEIDAGRLELLKDAGRKGSVRARRGQIVEGKRSISSNK